MASVRATDEEKGLLLPTADEKKAKARVLLFCFIGLLVSGLGNSIFNKLQTYPMYNYPFFLSILTTAVYIPVSFAYIIPMLLWGDNINAESQSIPKYKFAVMGALDGIAGALSIFSIAYITNAPMIVMLTQAGVPISMVISKVFLNVGYTASQYVGALIVMIGLSVVLIPSFLTQDTGADAPEHSQLLWSMVMVLSVVPSCLSSVYKEKALGEVDIDVVYLNGWVAIFQFLVLFPFSIPSSYAAGLTPSEIIPNLEGGLMCLAGYNTVTEESLAAAAALAEQTGAAPPTQRLDDCSSAPAFVTMYLIFNLSYNLSMIMMLKYGSASLMYIALTMMVPLANIAFALPVVPHPHSFADSDVAGLAFIMFGLFVYRFAPKLLKLLSARGAEGGGASLIEDDSLCDMTPGSAQHDRTQALLLGGNPEMVVPVLVAHAAKRRRVKIKSPEEIRKVLVARVLGTPTRSPGVLALQQQQTLMRGARSASPGMRNHGYGTRPTAGPGGSSSGGAGSGASQPTGDGNAPLLPPPAGYFSPSHHGGRKQRSNSIGSRARGGSGSGSSSSSSSSRGSGLPSYPTAASSRDGGEGGGMVRGSKGYGAVDDAKE